MMKKLEIIEETAWVVHNPWTAQDIASFLNESDAKFFAEKWERKHGR